MLIKIKMQANHGNTEQFEIFHRDSTVVLF